MTALTLTALVVMSAVAVWMLAMRGVRDPTTLSVIAALAAAGAAGRLLLGGLPGIEPVTAIVICVSVTLGVRAGIGVGALTIVLSNTLLGHGPWTFWQVLGFAAVALSAGVIVPRLGRSGRGTIAVMAGASAVGYDLLLVASQPIAMGFEQVTADVYVTFLLVGAPLMLVHVVGAAAVTWLVGPTLLDALSRVATRRTGVRLGAHSPRHAQVRAG